MWTKEIIKHLIREFKSHELLYDQTHIHYSNREKRQKSLEEICKSLKKYNDEITVECVQKKIKSLRGQFTTANKLKAESVENATDEDDICQPTLWCYDELRFLSDCKSKVLEANNLKRVWAELDQMQRKFRKEIDNPRASVNYEDEPLTSSASTTRSNDSVSQLLQRQNKMSLPSSDVDKKDVAVKQELYNEDPAPPPPPASKVYSQRKIEMNSPNVAVSATKTYTEQKTKTNRSNDTAAVTKAYSEQSTETNSTSDEKSIVIPLLQQQLQMQMQQLQIITSMLKSIERLTQEQINARRLKTAAIERLTEATERQIASLGNLMIQYQEGECGGEDLTDIIYME